MTQYYIFPTGLMGFDKERPTEENYEVIDNYSQIDFENAVTKWQQSGVPVECDNHNLNKIFDAAYHNLNGRTGSWWPKLQSGINVTTFISIDSEGKAVFKEGEEESKDEQENNLADILEMSGKYSKEAVLKNFKIIRK